MFQLSLRLRLRAGRAYIYSTLSFVVPSITLGLACGALMSLECRVKHEGAPINAQCSVLNLTEDALSHLLQCVRLDLGNQDPLFWLRDEGDDCERGFRFEVICRNPRLRLKLGQNSFIVGS